VLEEETVAKPGQSIIEFACETYAVFENVKTATVRVVRAGAADKEVDVRYETVDGTAVAGADYEGKKGTLTFKPGVVEHDISVKVFDDDIMEEDEWFSIQLEVLAGDAVLGAISKTRITVINDDFPGIFVLPKEEIKVKESCGRAIITVERAQGCSGRCSMSYRTIDGTAIGGTNYEHTEGVLEWGHQETPPKEIEIEIIDDDVLSGTTYFELELHSATGGAVFDEKTDGSKDRSIARVTIVDDDAVKTIAERAIIAFGASPQMVNLEAASWAEQFSEAVKRPDNSSPLAWVQYVSALPWKLLVAAVPPVAIAGGYPSFVVAIIVIGALTAVIGDLASLLGCSMGIKNEVVAFTFVALGTSLPDTFASRTAALCDPTADAAIGNVTGSNAVNVYLGLGFSFIIGAVYWTSIAGDDEVRWLKMLNLYYSDTVVDHYGGVAADVPYGLPYPAGSLSFSVIVFSTCACACLGTLSVRRVKLGAELGSLFRWQTFVFFLSLWLVYVTLSTFVAYDKISSG